VLYAQSIARWAFRAGSFSIDDGGDFNRTVFHSTLVGVTASVLATQFGSMAAYVLVRFRFRAKLGASVIFFVIKFGGYLSLFEYVG